MASQRTVNTFNEGMAQDVDKLNQQNASYRYSKNGKLIFNEDGTFSWENEKGNKFSFTINAFQTIVSGGPERIPVGYANGPNYFVLFSTNASNDFSEIGIVTIDENGDGKYSQLFSDSTDPNGDLFNFSSEIEAILLPEVDNCIRVYWVDGVKDVSQRPGSFTFQYDGGDRQDSANYSAITASVHNSKLQAEFQLGLIKYVKSISGGLTTGVYQYAYRLGTEDGYRTPFSPLTRSIFVTVDAVSGTNWHEYEMEGVGINSGKGNQIQIKGVDERYTILEVAYIHAQSSEVLTDANIFVRTEITGHTMTINHTSNEKTQPIDPSLISQRFSNIEKAKTINVKDNTMYMGNIYEGESVIDAEPVIGGLTVKPIYKYMKDDKETSDTFDDRPLPSSGTYNAERDYEIPFTHGALFTGTTTMQLHNGVGGTEDYTIDNDYINYKGTQVEHLYKGFRRGETYRFGIVFYDKLGQPGFVYHLADVKFPELYENTYTAQRVKEDGTVVTLSTSSIDKAYITNDYGNTNALLTAAASNQFIYNTDTESSISSHLRIMGVEFGGIDISSIKDDITGYQIVRAELDNTILYQGIVVPCVVEEEYDSGIITEQRVMALPTPQQIWRAYAQTGDPDAWSDDGMTVLADDDLREPRRTNDAYNQISLRWQAGLKPNGNLIDNHHINYSATSEKFYFPMPNISATYFPELNFEVEDTINGPSINPNDRLKVVGVYYGDVHPTGEQTAGINCSQLYALYWNFDEFSKTLPENKGVVDQHTVQKLYYTNLSDKFKDDWNIHLSVGEKATPERKKVFTGFTGKEENALSVNDMTLYQEVRFGFRNTADADLVPSWDGNKKFYGYNINRSIFYKTGNWGSLNKKYATAKIFQAKTRQLRDTVNAYANYYADYNCFNIINYVRENNSPYGGLTKPSIETTVFESSGHFQPVNNSQFTVPDTINGIQVFGGDTYVHCIDFVRVMPNFTKWESTEEDGFNTTPYPMGQAIIVPLESKINMALRQRASEQNPSFANNGMRTQGAYSGRDEWKNEVSYQDGVYHFNDDNQLLEEWNYQDALSYTETVQFFAPIPFGLKLNSRFPVRWRYSGVKIYGDSEDEFRKFLVNDFRDMDGRYGDIIASSYLFDQIYVLQEEGFSRLRAYDRALLQSENLGTLTTGVGDRLQGQDYINTKIGTQHQFSVVNSGKAIYWLDAKKRKLCRFAQNGVELISDERGMHQFFDNISKKFDTEDSPIFGKGVTGTYDYTNNTMLLSFTGIDKYTGLENGARPDDSEYTTISFNENINAFVSFHDYIPNMYISHKGFVLSVDTQLWATDRISRVTRRGSFYVHEMGERGRYYLDLYDSSIDVITRENMMYHKTFDNIRMNINDASAPLFTQLTMTTENQTEVLDIQNDHRAVLKENIFRVPLRGLEQTDRMRGKHITNKFLFDNISDTLVRFTSLETLFRMSNRL